MTTPLLTTKFHIPTTRPELVSRPRLVERLNAGLHRKLTVISAPAGFGKTTLLSEWVAGCGRPAAWVALDQGDNDPVKFWAYFVAALQMVGVSVREGELGAFQSPQSAPIEPALTGLINAIASVSTPFILVLDDYHLIKARSIHDAVTFLLDHLPPPMHLALATRADPPLSIARLRGRGQVTELRLTDLRFTSDQAAEFLNQVLALGLSADDVSALASRTEGWISGLQMAALSIQGREDAASFVRAFTGSDRYILDYLVEEVLQRQPDSIQAFLLQTSILDQLSGPLCDAVVQEFGDWRAEVGHRAQSPISSPQSQTILEYLESANLFIVPLDNERQWYRYHRLFSDLLRSRLHRSPPSVPPAGGGDVRGGVAELHRRASEWYGQNGLMPDAIDHALSAGDFERAADLIERVAEATLMRSEVVTLLGWVDALPDEMVRARPSLCIFHAWALLFGGRPLDTIESRLEEVDKGADFISGGAAPLRAFVAIFQGDVSRAAELSREALEQLPEENVFLRGIATWVLSVARMTAGDLVGGMQALDEAIRTSQASGNVMLAVMVLCNLAELHMRQGRLGEAENVYRQALALAADQSDRYGQPLPIAGMALMGLGEVARERDDLDAAERYATEGMERIGQWGEIGALDGLISLAYIRQARGDVAGARDAIHEAEQIAIKFDATEMDDILVALHRANLEVMQGGAEPAARWLEERGLTVDVGLAELEERRERVSSLGHRRRTLEYFTFVRVLIAQERHEEALALLKPMLAIAEKWELNERVIRLQVFSALALSALGDIAQAMGALEQALSLAEPEGYVRVFLDGGEPMVRLLREAVGRGVAPDYASRLLAAFGVEEQESREKSSAVLVEPLSKRELDVLRLLITHLSSTEIAEELSISANTVRFHIKNIYGKLSVHSRTEAVARAKELELL